MVYYTLVFISRQSIYVPPLITATAHSALVSSERKYDVVISSYLNLSLLVSL